MKLGIRFFTLAHYKKRAIPNAPRSYARVESRVSCNPPPKHIFRFPARAKLRHSLEQKQHLRVYRTHHLIYPKMRSALQDSSHLGQALLKSVHCRKDCIEPLRSPSYNSFLDLCSDISGGNELCFSFICLLLFFPFPIFRHTRG